MAVDDRSIKIPVELDDRQAQKELNRLENSIRKAQDSIARKNIKKDGITAQLEEATRKADALQAKLDEINAAKERAGARRSKLSDDITEAQAASDNAKNRVERLNTEIETARNNAKRAARELGMMEETAAKDPNTMLSATGRAAILDARAGLEGQRQKVSELNAEYERLVAEQERQKATIQSATAEAGRLRTELSTVPTDESFSAPIKETQAALKEATAEVKRRQTEEARVNQQILDEEANIRRMTGQYNTVNAQLQQQGSSVWPQLRQQAGVAMAGVSTAISKSMKTMLKYGLGIRSVYILFRKLRSALIDGIKQFAEYDAETKNNLNNLKSALAGLKGSFAAAFAPIVNAVVPYLVTFINWIAKAIDAVSMFFAILGGKSTYKRAVSNISAVGAATSGAADAAAEAEKNFSGLDELNIFQENSGSGGGGGGGGGGSGGGLSWEDAPVNTGGFAAQLAFTVQDVLFDWSDLTAEQIAEKIVAGLGMLAGAIIGFHLGGVGGAVIGAVIGLGVTMVLEAMIFDHDGQLDRDEILSMIMIALGTFAGGVIGFMLGGPGGALLGASIGFGLTLLITGLTMQKDENGKKIWDGYDSPLEWVIKDVLGLSGGTAFAVEFSITPFVSILDHWDEIKKTFADAWDETKTSLIEGWETFKKDPTIQKIGDFFSNPIGSIDDGISSVETKLSNWWALIKAWFSDYFVRGLAQIGIDAANGLIEPIESGINSAIDKLNAFIREHPKFADFFGLEELDHIELTLIPDLDPPVGTYYKQTKEQIEAESKKNPTDINSKANMTDVKNGLTQTQRTFGAWANFTVGKQNVPIAQRTFGSTANFVKSKDGLTWDQTTFGSRANFVRSKDGMTWAQTTFGSIANFVRSKDGMTWDQTTFGSIANFYRYYNNLGTPWMDSGANLTDYYRAWSGAPWVNVSANVAAIGGSIITTGNWASWRQFADGGVISKGFWNALPKYGGGTRNAHGSLFVAGEAGPEVLGHIGGRTEVLNRSQLASTMYAAITSGMSQALSKLKFKVDSSDLIQVVHAAKESIERMRTSVEHIAYVLSSPNLALAGPAVATGTVIPPMLINISEDLEGIKEAVDRLTARIDNLSTDRGDINLSARVRERVLFEMTIEQGKAIKQQTGKNPFDI